MHGPILKDPVAVFLLRFSPLARLTIVIFGAVLIHLSLGTYHTFGNMLPYMASYMHNNTDPTINPEMLVWIPTFQGCFPFAMIIGGFIDAKFGLRFSASLGCIIMTTGVFLSYWTIRRSFIAFLVTYGIMFGFGQGIAYVLTVSCVINWAPKHVGFVSGIVAAGFGISSSIFAPLQTIYLNPLNHKPTVFAYFTDKDVIARVPSIFYTFAVVYGIMQAIGLIVICNPVDVDEQSEALQMQISTSVWNWFDVFESKCTSFSHNMKQYTYSRLRTFSQGSIREQEQISLSPLQMLQSSTFYWLFCALFCCSFYGNMFYNLYKTFGETFIDDDMFIACAFSIASICNALARIGWGILADRTSFQVSLSSATFLATMLLLTMPLTPAGGKWIYFIWMNLMFICLAATHALFITASVKCFGSNHKSINYGCLILSTTLSAILLAVGCEYVLTVVGYAFSFLITAILAFLAFLLAITMQRTTRGHFIT
ncbi:Major Facilitator Superfamily protein [Brugia malayi]|uniref:Bm6932 n=1 Tax=Brugia malayi TaxID=6279 RepID=A0A0K0JQ86_BRUMA|nr:Major Facilitator Superfamily protein [Brugia malayi]CTP81476.1 Bm6932 [Brugia malayi]VIO98116.1 Major Facilitator Superfamily protein [Brugia malayi]